MNRRFPAFLLALLLVGSMLSVLALAAGAEEETDPPEATTTSTDGLVLNKTVQANEDGTFTLQLESYATGTDGTTTEEPLPLDIVLVLDESGSMADTLVQGCGDDEKDVQVTAAGHLLEGNESFPEDELEKVLFIGHKVFSSGLDEDKTYQVVYPEASGTGDALRTVSYCEICNGWYSTTSHADHSVLAQWIPFTGDEQDPLPTRKGSHGENNWAYHVQFYEACGQTGREVLQDALRNFLNSLQASSNSKKVDNRVAIVGYGIGASYILQDGGREQVYPDRGDSPDDTPVANSVDLAKGAWCNVSELTKDTVSTWVNGVEANGSTPTHLGIQAAKLAFENAPSSGNTPRGKVMILFTDGAPGGGYRNYGPGRLDELPDWVTPAIQAAKDMKDKEATIYSIGLFPGADGYNAGNISYDVTQDGQGTEGFYKNANCFLHLVSSNYPHATGVTSDARGTLNSDYVEGQKSYYLGTQDANQLNDIFNRIFEEVTKGQSAVTLGADAVVKDIIADDFQLVNGSDSVIAWTESYGGKDSSGNNVWNRDTGSESTNAGSPLAITTDGKTVNVTGFDFAGNFVHMDENSIPQGKKLVVQITIQRAEDTLGGTKLPTNADGSGVYTSADATDPFKTFPCPYVDLSTTVTVKKVVSGTDSKETFKFHAGYSKAENYENVNSEVANGSNYLHFIEGTSVSADQFHLAADGTHPLENVEVGSTLTIWEDVEQGWLTPTVTTSEGTQALTPDGNGKYSVTVTPGMVITFTNIPDTTPAPAPDPEPSNESGGTTPAPSQSPVTTPAPTAAPVAAAAAGTIPQTSDDMPLEALIVVTAAAAAAFAVLLVVRKRRHGND